MRMGATEWLLIINSQVMDIFMVMKIHFKYTVCVCVCGCYKAGLGLHLVVTSINITNGDQVNLLLISVMVN